MKLLLVETDINVLVQTAQALRREGFSVSTATGGSQALQRWQAEQPDLVLLEVGLPDLSGFDVCRLIREQGSTPVILLSAVATNEQIVQGFRVGADDYVVQPIRPQELVRRIQRVWQCAVIDLAPEDIA